MNTSAFISAVIVALASYAAAAPVPDGETGNAGNAPVSSYSHWIYKYPVAGLLDLSFADYSSQDCVGGCGVN